MISVIIPTLDAETSLGPTLAALVPAAVDGVVREVIVADGGSSDHTLAIADDAGAVIVKSERGRGPQLIAGAQAARSEWLLFLHADTTLEVGWEREAAAFVSSAGRGARADAAAFRFALDDRGLGPRLVERMVAVRSSLLKLPFGDQGLLISRRLYDAIGGYRPLPIMEDVDIVRRLGRTRLVMLEARAVTSASRYQREGYVKRVLRNQSCLAMYFAGIEPERICRRYQGGAR